MRNPISVPRLAQIVYQEEGVIGFCTCVLVVSILIQQIEDYGSL